MEQEPLSPLTDPNSSMIEKAVYFCGGASKVAAALGLSRGAIYKWIQNQTITAEHVIPLEKLSGGYVNRHQLRPDIYPRDGGTDVHQN